MAFIDDFAACNADFLSGLDGRSAYYNGKTIPVFQAHSFAEQALLFSRKDGNYTT